MKRFLSILTIAMSVLAPMTSFIQPAQADTVVNGNWTWTDISDQLTTRTNRPIWAVAQANGSWFYTDGQNLWNNGQAYRYDGSTQINITTDVRNAGIDRIDDIVSDGQTVLFLQDVVRLDDSLRVVAYTQGQYVNITSYVQNVLATNEGINQIVGNSGTWYVTTTKGRLLRWNGLSSNPTVVTLPSNVNSYLDHSRDDATYNVNHGSTNAYDMNIGIASVSNSHWVLAFRVTNTSVFSSYGNGSAGIVAYSFDGSTFTQLQQSLGNMGQLNKIVSNNNQAYLFGRDRNSNPMVLTTSGDSLSQTSAFNGTDITNADMRNVSMVWNGTSWMIILNNKNVYRFDGSTLTSYGRMRDFLTTVAGDGNGRFLLGGAVSTIDNNQPTSPLTAKLVMVTEGSATVNSNGSTTVTTGGSFGGDRVYTSTNGPRVTTQGNPSGFRIGSGKEFAYRVTASDNSGIDRIDVYMNGALIKTCNDTVCEYRTTLYTKGQSTRTIPFYTRVTNKNGYSTDTGGSPDILTVDINSSLTADGSVTTNTNTTSNSASGISSWTWLDPNSTSLTNGNSITYYVGANDTNGINKIDIYANGTVVKSCPLYNATGNQQCSFTAYASNYSQGTNVSINARIVDGSGLESWTSMTTLVRNTDTASTNNSTNNVNSSSGISSWSWLDPNSTTLTNGNTTTYYVGANDSNGINRIEIYVNGSIVKTCSLNNWTGNQQCAFPLYASNYTQGSTLSVNARIVDGSGLDAWTSMTSIYRSTDNGSSNTNSNTSNDGVTNTWIWLDPNVTSLNADSSTGFNVGAQDSDGISKIEIVANGNIIKTCSLGNSTASVSCYGGVYGSNYAANSSIFVNAKVTDANGNATWTDSKTLTRNADASTSNNSNNSTNTPTNSWIWVDPNVTSFNKADSMSFNVGAQDNDGINKIEIVANGNTVKTCSLGNAMGNQQCTYSFTGNTTAANTDIFINAKVTDKAGIVTWSDSKSLHRNADTSTSNTNNSNNSTATTDSVSSWDWLDPSVESLGPNATSTYHVGSWAARGVSSVSLYLDGKVVKTCSYYGSTGNLDCAYLLNGASYQAGTTFFINALVQSAGGAQSWTTGKTISVAAATCSGTSCTATNAGSSVNGWVSAASDKDASGYSSGGIISIASAAYDPDGVARIDIYTNGTRLKTCNNLPVCNATATTDFYNASFSYQAIMTDRLGNAISTGYKTIYKK